jgi:hypothetical protein
MTLFIFDKSSRLKDSNFFYYVKKFNMNNLYYYFYILIIYNIKKIKMAESGTMMVAHSLLIGIIIYIIFIFMGVSQTKAENRSAIVVAIGILYMVLFGHGMPGEINAEIF